MTASGPLSSPDVPLEALPLTGDPPADSLARLLSRSACGDEIAFTALYDATAARVHGLVLRLVRNRAIGEEVTQEVYLQVWRTASRYEESRGSALSWLMTLAHRRAVDRIRATEAHSRRDTTYLESNSSIAYDSTYASAEASLSARKVRTALASLSAIQRQSLELAYFGGYTHSEVAEIAGIPIGTAKTRIRDGLIRLRTLVDDAG